jgi:hypothetical protein
MTATRHKHKIARNKTTRFTSYMMCKEELMKKISILLKPVKSLLILTATSVFITACGAAGGQPTISPGLVATMVAMTLQAVTPQASPAVEATATAVPPTFTVPPSTATFAPAPTRTNAPTGTRIHFATGATANVVEGQIQAGEARNFLVGAAAGQPLIIMLDSINHDVTFSVKGQKDGAVLLPASQASTSWQTMLTTTQDYLVQLYGGASTENFTLNIIIPARVAFDPGAISAQRSGSTPGGLIVSYVVRASAGQKMKLQLGAPGGNAVLGVYGYQDGQPYLRSAVESTTFDMTLPATEDYIIQVIPRGGEVASYNLNVEIK